VSVWIRKVVPPTVGFEPSVYIGTAAEEVVEADVLLLKP
jgi:hypothetical protein